jgi:hypothetical protein
MGAHLATAVWMIALVLGARRRRGSVAGLRLPSANSWHRLQQDSYDRFLTALDTPPEPVAKLVDQIRKSRPLKHAD